MTNNRKSLITSVFSEPAEDEIDISVRTPNGQAIVRCKRVVTIATGERYFTSNGKVELHYAAGVPAHYPLATNPYLPSGKYGAGPPSPFDLVGELIT